MSRIMLRLPAWDHMTWRTGAGEFIPRGYGASGREYRHMKGPGAGKLNCVGSFLGLCEDGRVRHYRTYNAPQRFVGIHHATVDSDRIEVCSRGSMRVFVHGNVDDVDSLSTKPGPGSAEMGVVLSLESDKAGYCIVAFKAYDDFRPLEPQTFRA